MAYLSEEDRELTRALLEAMDRYELLEFAWFIATFHTEAFLEARNEWIRQVHVRR